MATATCIWTSQSHVRIKFLYNICTYAIMHTWYFSQTPTTSSVDFLIWPPLNYVCFSARQSFLQKLIIHITSVSDMLPNYMSYICTQFEFAAQEMCAGVRLWMRNFASPWKLSISHTWDFWNIVMQCNIGDQKYQLEKTPQYWIYENMQLRQQCTNS